MCGKTPKRSNEGTVLIFFFSILAGEEGSIIPVFIFLEPLTGLLPENTDF